MLNYHGRDSGRPDAALPGMQRSPVWEPQPIRTANDAEGYVKSQLHQLDISHEIQELMDNSEDDVLLRNLDYAYGLRQSMRSKMALLGQARMLHDLTITRLREGADRMEAEQRELSALQAKLKVNLQRAEKYIETQEKAAIDKVMKENNLTIADVRKMLQPCQPDETSQRSQGSAMSANSDNK